MKFLLPVALLVLVQYSWVNICVSGSELRCREKERLALLQINAALPYIHSLDGKLKWEGKECCRWERVTCDPTTGHVTKLDLFANEYWFDYGQDILLNASLFLPLRELRSLSLSRQGIRPGAGFETWANLTRLEILDLSMNNLDGSIIYDLASVSSLRKLDPSDNNIRSNQLINGHKTWSNLTKLEILNLSKNNLDGSIIYDLSSVSSLRTLDLSENNISLLINGFESWSNLTKLEMLDLSENYMSTSIISSLAKILSLRALYLDYNLMEGKVPVNELINALSLEVVSLSRCIDCEISLLDFGHWSSLKALSLADTNLNDTLALEGLCRLKNLEELDLSFNKFAGNLPLRMRNLSSLKLVDLQYNQFQVKFPSIIFERLVSLQYLSLAYNQFEGTLSLRSFLNHSNLEVLMLSTNDSLKFRVEVAHLPSQLQVLELANCILDIEPTFLYSQHNLRELDLSNTRSKGPLSAVWLLLQNNTNLIKLDLHKNFFTEPLQLPFLTHEKLSILDISDNHLCGELPANLTTKLPNLLSLTLSKNYFQGPLPLMSTNNLQTLDLSSNNLTDNIHNSFSRIQPSIPSVIMDLSNNKFYGSLTNNLNFTPSSILLLNDNNISGENPVSICNTSMEVLEISNNQLNGGLPDCIGKAKLSILKLNGNNLEGSLPSEMCVVGGLLWLDLSDNKLSGSIPTCYNESDLEIVDLSQNNISGKFPITWLNISNIYAIDIRKNHLYGELLAWIGEDCRLKILQASENRFGGIIPEQICQFKYLRILDLSYNDLLGQIPSCIFDMGSMEYDWSNYNSIENEFNLQDTQVSYVIDAKFLLHALNYIDRTSIRGNKDSRNFGLELMSKGRSDFYWEEILKIQCLIDLSSNKLVGNIPKDIGQMNWLITFNLSNNHLSGIIPNSISNLQKLECLDFSHNSLIGEIPRELTKLTSLASFSVAYNNLSGPTLGVEAQFVSFDESSYEGNPNLCGPPLLKSCVPTPGKTQPFPNEMSDDRRYNNIDFLILFGSFSLSFVVSFWSFIAILYFKRNWCYALFTLVDWYGDMIHVKIETARTRRGN